MKTPNSQNELLSISSLLNRTSSHADLRERYLSHPWDFAIEDPEGRYETIIGIDRMTRAAEQDFLGFSDFQKKYLAAFVDVTIPRMIVRTGRGGSKTMMASLGTAILAYALPRFSCTINAGSLKQSKKAYRYWKVYAEAPDMLASRGGPLLEMPKATQTRLKNNGMLEILAASETQAQAPHPHLVVYDEACVADPYIMELVEGQLVGGVPPDGASGPLYRIQSTGTELIHPFVDKWNDRVDLGYFSLTWGARDCPWITEESILQDELEHDQNWITIHIEGRFGSATGMIFQYEDIKYARVPTVEEDPWKIWPFVVKHPHFIKRASLGIDWGMKAWTTFIVIVEVDIPAGERRPLLDEMKERGEDPPTMWPIYYVVHIEGMRNTSADAILEEAQIVAESWNASAYPDSSDAFMNDALETRLADAGLGTYPVVFSKYKMSMIGHFRSWLERKRVRIPRTGRGRRGVPIRGDLLLNQLAAYSWEKKVEKPKKGNDDFVDGIICAAWGLKSEGDSRVRVIPR